MSNKITKKEMFSDQSMLEKLSNSFQDNIQSINVFINVIGKVADEHDSKTLNESDELIDNIFQPIYKKLDKKRKKNKLKGENVEKEKLSKKEGKKIKKALYRQISKNRDKLLLVKQKIKKSPPRQGKLLRKNSLITLMSTFETLISNIIQEFYNKFPNAFSSDNKKISLSEIRELGSIEDAEKYLIDSEIDSVLRNNINFQMEYLTKTLSLNTDQIDKYMDELTEVSQRRNIVVHNNGIVNRQYVKKTPNSFIHDDIVEDKEIDIDISYLQDKLRLIHLIGIILIQQSIRKWEKQNIERANDLLNNILFDAIVEKDYLLAENICSYIYSINISSERDKKMFIINHAICLKKQDKIKEMEELLSKYDWSAVSTDLVMALNALKGNSIEFYKSLKNLIKTSGLESHSLKTWPIFDDFREDKKFHQYLKRLELKEKTNSEK